MHNYKINTVKYKYSCKKLLKLKTNASLNYIYDAPYKALKYY